jgi:hypothetical protein
MLGQVKLCHICGQALAPSAAPEESQKHRFKGLLLVMMFRSGFHFGKRKRKFNDSIGYRFHPKLLGFLQTTNFNQAFYISTSLE